MIFLTATLCVFFDNWQIASTAFFDQTFFASKTSTWRSLLLRFLIFALLFWMLFSSFSPFSTWVLTTLKKSCSSYNFETMDYHIAIHCFAGAGNVLCIVFQPRFYSSLLTDYCFRRTQNGLQKSYRSMQQPQSGNIIKNAKRVQSLSLFFPLAGPPWVLCTPALQSPLPFCWRMVHTGPEPPSNCLSCSPIHEQASYEWGWPLWSYQHHECWCPVQMPTRGLDQARLLPTFFLFLPLWVSALVDSFFFKN